MSLLRGYLYVIADKDRKYAKVGMSRDVLSRFVDLQSSCPLHLEIVHAFPCTYVSVREVMVHQKLKELWVRGEWFHWDEERIRTAMADVLAFPDDTIKKTLAERGLLDVKSKPKKPYDYPVKRLDTGEAFPSAKVAALTVFGSAHIASKIKKSIKQNCFCGPCKWAVAEDDEVVWPVS